MYDCLFLTVWVYSELADLLVMYKNMLLNGLQKDNYKELSKKMIEAGWDRNNDQCRQQVNSLNSFLFYFFKRLS